MTHRYLPLVAAFTLALASAVQAEPPEGLYSMDGLIGSDVYLVSEGNREAGEVEDVLVAENMKVHGLVIELDDDLEGVGDDDYRFVEVDQFSVATRAGDRLDRVSYAVFLNDELTAVRDYPRVDNDWWRQTKQAAAEVWDSTKSGASSAWQATKETTSDVIDRTKEGARDMLESLQRTLE